MSPKIDLKDAYFHGVGGNEINFFMYPKSALYISMLRIEDILKSNGIHSREKQKELNVGHPEFGTHIGFDDIDSTNHFVSICTKNEKEKDTAFEDFVEGKISIALKSDISKRYDFRSKDQYHPDVGEEQILDSIDISEFIAIVVDIENEQYRNLAINSISKLLNQYKKENILITNSNGDILIDESRDFER